MSRIFSTIVAAALLWPATAGAQRAAPPDAQWDRNGDPLLIAYPVPGGKGAVSWRECPADQPCRPLAGGRFLTPGRTPAGTRFELVVEYHGRRTRATSHVWNGRLRPATAPALTGTPSVGSWVRPTPATWIGGWRGYAPRHELRIESCRTACVTVAEPLRTGPGDPLAGTPVTIPAWAAGRPVQVLDEPVPRDLIHGGPAYLTTEAVPPLRRTPTVALSTPVPVSPSLLAALGVNGAAWPRAR